jgi:hypothetical protein
MSQGKERFVSVNERELAKLREQESRLRSVQQDLPDRLNRIREEARQDMQQRIAPLEQRTKQQEQESQRLRSGLADLECTTQQRLQQQRTDFQKSVRESEVRQQQALNRESTKLRSAMREGFEQQRGEYLRITAQQRQEYISLNQQLDLKFSQLIEEERQSRETGQQILQQQIDGMVENEEYKKKLAQDLLADVEQVWQQIDRDYQHQRFAPNKLADLRRNLEFARQNLATGVFEGVIATSQETYLKLADLRLELEQKEQEWLLYYSITLEDLRALITEAQAHREVEAELGIVGSEVETFRIEVDYWTDGCLSAYEQKLNAFEQQLKDGEQTITTEQVKQLADEIEALRPELVEIADRAKMGIILSQMRAEIADKVVELMLEYGYQPENPDSDAVYEGSDYRNAYVVKVKNSAGEEVVTVISPEKEFGANTVSINAFSDVQDDKELGARAEEIFNALNQEVGLDLKGETQCYDQPREEYRDIEKVRSRQVKHREINRSQLQERPTQI